MEIRRRPPNPTCLLYTSDAADDLTRVDLGGRRIIKKKVSLEDLIKKIEKLPTPKDFYKNILES